MKEWLNNYLGNSDEDEFQKEMRSMMKALLDEQTETLLIKLSNNINGPNNLENEQLRSKVQNLQDERREIHEKLQSAMQVKEKVLNEKRVADEQLEKLRKDKDALEKRLDVVLLELEEKKQMYLNQVKETNMVQQCLAEAKVLNEKYDRYYELDKVYEQFLTLNEETMLRLKNVYPKADIYTFLAASLQWDNIIGLWNFLKTKVVENDTVDLNTLHDIFLVAFKVYNKQGAEEVYQLISPEIGVPFDNDIHVILGTKTDGIIQRTCLEGIQNRKTRKVLNKALVLV